MTHRDPFQPLPFCDSVIFGHKQKHSKFCLNMRKTFFNLRVTEHWNLLPREFVKSFSLEIFKTHQDTVLCILL